MLLSILKHCKRPPTKTALVKLAFLVRNALPIQDSFGFYEFLPYKFGPFSFSLYRELSELEKAGHVNTINDRLVIQESGLTGIEANFHSTVKNAITSTCASHSGLEQEDLVRGVYRRFPWYASRTERKDLLSTSPPSLPELAPAIYSVGYEGRTIDSFLNHLLFCGVKQIVDVRANPISRKYGFSKNALRENAGKLGIVYSHHPLLGIPSAFRRNLNSRESYQELLDKYENEMLPLRSGELASVAVEMKLSSSALLCFEKDVTCCHRSRLAEALSRISGLAIKHL